MSETPEDGAAPSAAVDLMAALRASVERARAARAAKQSASRTWRADVDNRDDHIAAAARIEISQVITMPDVRLLAEGLLEIAELAMPPSYFAEDSRCQLARMVLDVTATGED